MDNIKLTKALQSLRPTSEWGCVDGEIVWLDKTQSKPTDEEILQEISRQEIEYSRLEYQRNRVEEYPSIEEQLDILFHGGYDVWKNQIQAVKDKYPKPE